MPKNKLLKILIIVALVLVVPILLGNVTARILEAVNPPSAMPLTRSLEHTRSITRTALAVIGVYYVVLVIGWLVLRYRKRKA